MLSSPASAQTTDGAATLGTTTSDTSGPALATPSPSLRPEEIGIVPIGANHPPPAVSTSEPIPLDTTEDSPRSLEDFFGPNEG
ncbi:MAG: hypothetical protein EBT07_12760, partial [Actinobacteria bacterium]|nr:hypothetical protein [Actinomycetota bacterium]